MRFRMGEIVKEDNGNNVVNLYPNSSPKPAMDSLRLSDGSAVLTDKLDPVLYAVFLEQKKSLEDALVANGKWNTAYEDSQKLMKLWRLIAYMGIAVVLLPQIVRAFLP